MKKLFSDVANKYKLETILFIVGAIAWLIDVFFMFFSEDMGFRLRTYFFPFIFLFFFLLFKLNKSEHAAFLLATLFFVLTLILFFWFLDYLIQGYLVLEIVGVALEMLFNIIIVVLLISKPKDGFIFLIISTFACVIYMVIEDLIIAIDYEYVAILPSTLFIVCFYILVLLIVNKQIGYKNVFARRLSPIEQELQVLKDKRELGILSEEEYMQKRNEIIKRII